MFQIWIQREPLTGVLYLMLLQIAAGNWWWQFRESEHNSFCLVQKLLFIFLYFSDSKGRGRVAAAPRALPVSLKWERGFSPHTRRDNLDIVRIFQSCIAIFNRKPRIYFETEQILKRGKLSHLDEKNRKMIHSIRTYLIGQLRTGPY